MKKINLSKVLLASTLFTQIFASQFAYSEKSVVVTRNTGPWVKTVFVDSFYGALIGGLGYGAYSLVSKKPFKGQDLGACAGIGFFAGAIVGIFDATSTESTAFINYSKSTNQLAFALPQTHILYGAKSDDLGGMIQLVNLRF